MRSINFLFVFLNLFDDMESRYPNRFVPGTMRIIRQCADYQKDMLFRESPIPPDQFESITLVATLLQCLIMSRDLAKFDMWSEGTQTLNGSTVVEMRPEEDDPYYGLLPSITIKRTDRPTDTTEPRYANESPQNFPVILTKCVALTQQTIFRRRPREFPGLVYCLCLMSLIAKPLRPLPKFMSPIIKAGDASTTSSTNCANCIYFAPRMSIRLQKRSIFQSMPNRSIAIVLQLNISKLLTNRGARQASTKRKCGPF